jgi:hypothetical protein
MICQLDLFIFLLSVVKSQCFLKLDRYWCKGHLHPLSSLRFTYVLSTLSRLVALVSNVDKKIGESEKDYDMKIYYFITSTHCGGTNLANNLLVGSRINRVNFLWPLFSNRNKIAV